MKLRAGAWGGSGSLLPLMVCASAAGTIAAHALLLPLGTWFPDEFIQFANHRDFGWQAVADRIFRWSPRPFSELLLFAYSSALSGVSGPGVAMVLALAWAATLTVLMVAARIGGIGPAVPLALVASALLAARPGEVWYWPAATLAYLPAFAGLGAAVLLMAVPAGRRFRDGALCAALMLAAGSVEVGAVAVLLLCAAQLARIAGGWLFPGLAPQERALVWLIPFALAGWVLLTLLFGRAGYQGEILAPSPVVGDALGSLRAAVVDAPRMLLGLPAVVDDQPVFWLGIPVKLALLAGFWALLPARTLGGAARLSSVVVAVVLLAAALASAMLAYHQFGTLCCQRHETFRQGLIVLALLAAAASLPRESSWARPAGQAVLAGVMVGLLVLRAPAIQPDMALIPETRAAHAANWVSGQAPGDAMTYHSVPAGRVTAGWELVPGVHRREDRGLSLPPGMSWHIFAILRFFDKLELRVESARLPQRPELVEFGARDPIRSHSCQLDLVNGRPPGEMLVVPRSGLLSVQGWAFLEGPPRRPADRMALLLARPEGAALRLPIRPVARADVALHFAQRELVRVGFDISMDLSGHVGTFWPYIEMIGPRGREVCLLHREAFRIGAE